MVRPIKFVSVLTLNASLAAETKEDDDEDENNGRTDARNDDDRLHWNISLSQTHCKNNKQPSIISTKSHDNLYSF